MPKSRLEKMYEYESTYSNIPKDYSDRLHWICDTYNINAADMDRILESRQRFIDSTYYQTIRIVLYEIPEATPRPRAHLMNRNSILNSIGNNAFIKVYSVGAEDNKEYIRLFKQEHLSYLDHLLDTPCDFELRAFFPTPKSFNKIQVMLAEIGLIRCIMKPDVDNIEKSYMDAFTDNIWIDDILVVDAEFHKYYSVLPRVEIDLKFMNQLYTKQQYQTMIKRNGYENNSNLSYFKE